MRLLEASNCFIQEQGTPHLWGVYACRYCSLFEEGVSQFPMYVEGMFEAPLQPALSEFVCYDAPKSVKGSTEVDNRIF